MKKLLTKSAKAILLLLVMLVFVQANAQRRYSPLAVTDMSYTIQNDVQLTDRSMAFDLYVKDTDASSVLEVALIQAGVLFSSGIVGTGTMTATFGNTEFVAGQIPAGSLVSTGATNYCIKLTPKSGTSCGSGTTLSTTGIGTRWCTVTLTNTVPFPTGSHANLNFCFTTSPYPTKVQQFIVCPTATSIACSAANCTQGASYLNIALNPSPTQYTVTGGGDYCIGGEGMPVGLSGSQTGVTYWLYASNVITTTFRTGTGGALDFGTLPGTLAGTIYTIKGVSAFNITSTMTGSATVRQISCTPTWGGAIGTSWDVPGNWVGGSVPLVTDDVIIPVGCAHYPVLPLGSVHACHNLSLAGNSGKSILTGGGLTIYGEMTISGSLTIASTGVLDLAPGGALTITGALTINGGLTVETNGSLITNGSVTGSADIQREITANLNWHLLSSPVTSQAICNGVFAPLISNFPGTEWDFYKWWANCPTPPNPPLHWRNLRNDAGGLNTADFGTTPGFEPTRGYMVAYGTGSTLPSTKVFHGVPNTGDKVCSFFDIFTECTWDLAGNPFPSALDWKLVTGKENLTTDYYYVWNQAWSGGAGRYEFSNGTIHSSSAIDGYIPAEQGFFVRVLFGSAMQIGMPNSARAHHNAADMWLKNEQSNRLTIQLSNGTNYDESYVMFMDGVSAGQDRTDAEKLFSNTQGLPQVYTIVDNSLKTALNAMSFVDNGTTIPVGILAPNSGTYTLTVNGIENFASLKGLSLEDLSLNYTQDLLSNPTYTFTAEGNEDASRFLLHFAGPIGIGEKNNSAINIYSNEKTVYITCAKGFKNAQVTISNLLGQQIVSQGLSDQTVNQVKVSALKGYYLVKVTSDTSVKTAKVYIN